MPRKKKPASIPKAPKPRRARGTGSIFFDEARGVYRARVIIGRLPSGKPKYTEVSGPTQAVVVERMRTAKPPGPDTTLAVWGEHWIKTADVREPTRDLYRTSLDSHIGPVLGHVRLVDVTAFHVETAAKKWGESLEVNTVRKVLNHLQSCFAAAERADLVARNPVRRAKKPAGELPELDPFTQVERTKIIDAAATDPKTYRLAILAATGCRIGEALALKPSGYNAAEGELTIEENLTRQHGTGKPKSKRSLRTIKVPLAARAACAELGPSYTYTTALRYWNALLKRLKIDVRGPHQARHSVATHLLAAGEPVGDVAKYLGDTPQTIIARYLHASGSDPCGTLDRIHAAAKVASE